MEITKYNGLFDLTIDDKQVDKKNVFIECIKDEEYCSVEVSVKYNYLYELGIVKKDLDKNRFLLIYNKVKKIADDMALDTSEDIFFEVFDGDNAITLVLDQIIDFILFSDESDIIDEFILNQRKSLDTLNTDLTFNKEGAKIRYEASKKKVVPTLNDLLDKISDKGMKSLTPEEKSLLHEYSKKESKKYVKSLRLFEALEN